MAPGKIYTFQWLPSITKVPTPNTSFKNSL
jgi:hypothetical protein